MTTSDLPLFAREHAEPSFVAAPRTPIERRFADFHRANPRVAELFEKYARDLAAAGATRIGVKAIAERIRWDQRIGIVSRDWRINNDYTALYARLIIHRRPDLAKVIETRQRLEKGAA